MKKTKVNVNISGIPKELRYLFENVTAYDSSCSTHATVYYLDSGYYVKTDESGCLAREAELNRLFYEKGIGVEVTAYVSEERDWLVTRSAKGDDLTHYLDEPEKLCELLAFSLHKLHAQSIENVPISASYKRYTESANGDFNGGCYDESVLLPKYAIGSKKEAWEIMQKGKHLLKADTLIHGDACLPNIIQNNGEFSSFIDLNTAGIGDKHIDLYLAIWSLRYNLKTDKYTELFLDLYGRENFDEEVMKTVAAFEAFG